MAIVKTLGTFLMLGLFFGCANSPKHLDCPYPKDGFHCQSISRVIESLEKNDKTIKEKYES